MCYKPTDVYDGCGCPRTKTSVIRCSEADLVDNICEILKEFEERANNRVCQKHYEELVKATEKLLRENGMLVEVRKALDLEWDDSDGETSDDSLLELVCDGRFELDGKHSVGVRSADGTAA